MMPSNIKSIINSQLKESVFKSIALNFAEKLFDSDPNEPGWKDVYIRNMSDLFESVPSKHVHLSNQRINNTLYSGSCKIAYIGLKVYLALRCNART